MNTRHPARARTPRRHAARERQRTLRSTAQISRRTLPTSASGSPCVRTDTALEAARVGDEHLGRHGLLDTLVFRDRGHADDLEDRVGDRTVAERFEHRERDALPDRILVAEIARDQSLVDDGELARVVDLSGGERAACCQTKAERLKVAFAAQLENRAPVFRMGVSRDLDVGPITPYGGSVVVSVVTTTPGNAWMRSRTARKNRCFPAAVVY